MRRYTAFAMGTALSVMLATAAQAAGPRVERADKDTGVTFRLISDGERAGFEQMRARDGRTLFVSKKAVLAETDIAAVEADAGRIVLTLTADAADKLDRAGVDKVAVVQNGRVTATPTLGTTSDGAVELLDLSTDQLNRLARAIEARAAVMLGTLVQLVPQQATGRPGDLFAVDIYVSGASNLRTYQVSLAPTGGESGTLDREEVWIDADRTDYVFGAAQVVKAVDEVNGRVGAVLFQGGVDVAAPLYVGTFTFRASSDAAGQFTIGLSRENETFLTDPDLVRFPLRIEPAVVTVSN